MPSRKLKPVPFHKFFDSETRSHKTLLLTEGEVANLVESLQTHFTKIDTVFENNNLSVVRIVKPAIDMGYDYLAYELLVASRSIDTEYKYLAIFSPIRVRPNEPFPDKTIRTALVGRIREEWKVCFK